MDAGRKDVVVKDQERPVERQQEPTPGKPRPVNSPFKKPTVKGLISPMSQRKKRIRMSLAQGYATPKNPGTAGSVLNPSSAPFVPGMQRHPLKRELSRAANPNWRNRVGPRSAPQNVRSVRKVPPDNVGHPERFELSWWPTPEQATKPVPADLHVTMAARAAAATAAAAAVKALTTKKEPKEEAAPYVFGSDTPGIKFNPIITPATNLKGTKRYTTENTSTQTDQKNSQNRPKEPEAPIVNDSNTPKLTTSATFEPPANAPKGPAAWRDAQVTENRLVQQRADITFPVPRTAGSNQRQDIPGSTQGSSAHLTASVPIRPTGTWSQSKAWVSERSRQQAAFNKMTTNLGHINAANSPAVPKTLAEYLEQKNWNAKREQKKLLRKISLLEMQQGLENVAPAVSEAQVNNSDQDEEEEGKILDEIGSGVMGEEAEALGQNNNRAASQAAIKPTARESPKPDDIVKTMPPKLLDGKIFEDRLSPFFASDTCWNSSYTDNTGVPVQWRVDWPSKADFQEYGDKRAAAGMRRVLPPPRENRLTSRLAGIVNNECSSLHARLKNIRLDRLSVGPCDNPHEDLHDTADSAQQRSMLVLAEKQDSGEAHEPHFPVWNSTSVNKAGKVPKNP